MIRRRGHQAGERGGREGGKEDTLSRCQDGHGLNGSVRGAIGQNRCLDTPEEKRAAKTHGDKQRYFTQDKWKIPLLMYLTLYDILVHGQSKCMLTSTEVGRGKDGWGDAAREAEQQQCFCKLSHAPISVRWADDVGGMHQSSVSTSTDNRTSTYT